MITIEEIQSIGIFTSAFFVIVVVTAFVSNEFRMKEQARIYNRSRWFLVYALMLLTTHYVFQRVVGFRHMEGNQAALINLIFYIPIDIFIHLAILNLLQLGKMKRWYYGLGVGIVVFSWILLFGAGLCAEDGLMGHSRLLHSAEYVTSAAVASALLFYNYEELKQYRALNREFDYYYDSPQQEFFRWFAVCIVLFMAVTFLSAIIIFVDSTIILFLHGAVSFTSIGFLVINFLHYGSDGSMMKMYSVRDITDEDDVNSNIQAEDVQSEATESVTLQAVNVWLATGHHLRAGITADEISAEMGISRNELKRYLKSQGLPKIGSWLAIHRIKEAKRLLLAHPEYSHDVIAEQSGFSSREYFQTCFRNIVGMPPMQWQKENRNSD